MTTAFLNRHAQTLLRLTGQSFFRRTYIRPAQLGVLVQFV